MAAPQAINQQHPPGAAGPGPPAAGRLSGEAVARGSQPSVAPATWHSGGPDPGEERLQAGRLALHQQPDPEDLGRATHTAPTTEAAPTAIDSHTSHKGGGWVEAMRMSIA